MISDPLTVSPDVTLADLDKLCGRFHISGLPVVDKDSKLVGIITNRDMRFIASEDYDRLKVSEVMTARTSSPVRPTSPRKTRTTLLAKHKVEKLPLVDSEGRLTGLITVKDFVKTEQYPDATKDEQGRLRVAAGVGFLGDAWQRASALMEAGVDVLVVDTANGEAKLALDMISRLKHDSAFDGVQIIGGNVGTRQGCAGHDRRRRRRRQGRYWPRLYLHHPYRCRCRCPAAHRRVRGCPGLPCRWRALHRRRWHPLLR